MVFDLLHLALEERYDLSRFGFVWTHAGLLVAHEDVSMSQANFGHVSVFNSNWMVSFATRRVRLCFTIPMVNYWRERESSMVDLKRRHSAVKR